MQQATLVLVFSCLLGSLAKRLQHTPLQGHGCRPDEIRYNNTCFRSFYLSASYENAKDICENLGASLSAPQDEDTFIFFQHFRIRQYISNFWIGLNDIQREGEWVCGKDWKIDNFTKWYPGEPNNIDSNQHCGQLWAPKNFLWDDNICELKQFYICQFQGKECDNNPIQWEDYCYEISTELASFSTASSKCMERGGSLACDKNQEIHDILSSLLKNRPWFHYDNDTADTLLSDHINSHTVTWIGIRFKDGAWSYEDGSPAKPFLKWKDRYEGSRKYCAAVEKDLKASNCDEKRPFICQYPVSSMLPILAEELQEAPICNIQLAFFIIGSFILGVLLTTGLIFLYKYRTRLLNRSLSVSHQVLAYSPDMVEE